MRKWAREAVLEIDLRNLRCFVEVARDLSFTRAALRLSLTQPQLSMRIRTFETRLGFRLFERSSRRVTLTPQGQTLLADAMAIIRHTERWSVRADTIRLELGSALRIGAISYGRPIRRRLLARYRELYPHVTVEVEAIRWGAEALTGFAEGRWDAAILLQMDGQTLPDLETTPIGRLPVGLLSPAAAAGDAVALFRRDIAPGLYDARLDRLSPGDATIVRLPEASEEGVIEFARETGMAVMCARWWDEEADRPEGLFHQPLPGEPLEISCGLARSRRRASPAGDRLWRLAASMTPRSDAGSHDPEKRGARRVRKASIASA